MEEMTVNASDEREIILADGTRIPGCSAGLADGNLWIYPEMTMKEAAALFLEEGKTNSILYRRSGEHIVYTGYTECIMLNAVPGGVRVLLVQKA